jgi:hypothetical protein
VISVALERPCGFLNRHEQFPTVLDISSCRDLHFPKMVEGVNRPNEADSATISEKQTLIFHKKRDSIRGFRIVEEPPHLRQFTARLEEIK